MNTTTLVDRQGNSIGSKMEITSRSPSPTDQMDVDSPRRLSPVPIVVEPTSSIQTTNSFNNKDILQPLRINGNNKQNTAVKEKLPPLSSLFPRDKFPPKSHSLNQQQGVTASSFYSGVHNLAKLPHNFTNTNSASHYSSSATTTQQQPQQRPVVGSLSSLVTSSRVSNPTPPQPQNQTTIPTTASVTTSANNPLLSNYLYFASSAASTAQSDPAGLTPQQQQQLSQPIIREGGWTEQEQKQFLLGVKECGWGSWKEISNKFVRSRTRKQVASHAQKFLIKIRKLQMEKLGVTTNPTTNNSSSK